MEAGGYLGSSVGNSIAKSGILSRDFLKQLGFFFIFI
jgi:hypothetical protein